MIFIVPTPNGAKYTIYIVNSQKGPIYVIYLLHTPKCTKYIIFMLLTKKCAHICHVLGIWKIWDFLFAYPNSVVSMQVWHALESGSILHGSNLKNG